MLLSLTHYPWYLFIKADFGQTSGHLEEDPYPNKPHDDQIAFTWKRWFCVKTGQKWNAGHLHLTTDAAPANYCCNFCQVRSWDGKSRAQLSVFYLGLGESLGQGKEIQVEQNAHVSTLVFFCPQCISFTASLMIEYPFLPSFYPFFFPFFFFFFPSISTMCLRSFQSVDMLREGGKQGEGGNAALELSSGKQNKQPTDDSCREVWLQCAGL